MHGWKFEDKKRLAKLGEYLEPVSVTSQCDIKKAKWNPKRLFRISSATTVVQEVKVKRQSVLKRGED